MRERERERERRFNHSFIYLIFILHSYLLRLINYLFQSHLLPLHSFTLELSSDIPVPHTFLFGPENLSGRAIKYVGKEKERQACKEKKRRERNQSEACARPALIDSSLEKSCYKYRMHCLSSSSLFILVVFHLFNFSLSRFSFSVQFQQTHTFSSSGSSLVASRVPAFFFHFLF